jgi:hypothetical protein
MNTSKIEIILKQAPVPKAPAGLKDRLYAQAGRSGMRPGNSRSSGAHVSAGWIRRWWPALAPAAVSLACATVFTFQQRQIRELKTPVTNVTHTAPAATITLSKDSDGAIQAGNAAAEQDEIARLQAVAAQLRNDVAQLEQLRGKNEALRKELAARALTRLSPEETQALEDASQNALSIQCINNMKQLGLAVRIWANDNGDATPPAVQFLTNEVGGAFQVFVCPADKSRSAASSSGSFSAANCSYEYLAPSTPDNDPQRVLFRCPIHGNIGLIDGSVQRNVVKEHPEWLVQRDGKLYMDATTPALQPGSANTPNQ